jgi:hypothetical protein
VQECLSNHVRQTAKRPEVPSAPFPTVAQSDYIQNGLVLPKDPKNLELLLRDVDAKGFLDVELVWKLRQKEGLKNVRGKIVRKIQQNEAAYSFEESVLRVLAESC